MPQLFHTNASNGQAIALVLGLNWRTVAMGNPVHVSRSVAKKQKATHLTLPTEKGSYAACTLKLPKGQQHALYSGARVLGLVLGTAFCALELPDQTIWVCWLKDGTPVVDEVIPMNAANVRERYRDYADMEGFANAPVYVSNATMLDITHTETLQFEDLPGYIQGPSDALLNALSTHAIPPKLLLLMLGLIVAVSAYYGYQTYLKKQKQQQLLSQQTHAVSNVSQQQQQAIKNWYDSQLAPNTAALDAVRSAIGQMRATPGAWNMTTIKCDAKPTLWSCTVDYKRSLPTATNQSLQDALPSNYALSFTSLTQASAAFSVPVVMRPLAANDIWTANKHDLTTVNALQTFDSAFSAAQLKPARKAELPVIKNADGTIAVYPAHSLVPSVRDIQLSGPLRNIDKLVNTSLAIAWHKLVITVADNAQPTLKTSQFLLTLSGAYYAQ